MIRLINILAAFGLAAFGAAATPAVPTMELAAQAETVTIRFDPPVGQPLRYRHGKRVEENGRTTAAWNIIEYVFTPHDEGYRLRVTALDSGVEDGDAAAAAAYRRVSRMAMRPYTLLVDSDGVITGMEDEQAYWEETLRVIREVIEEFNAPTTPAERAALQATMDLFGDMSAEARLALLTQDVMPILEFAATEHVVGETISHGVEAPGLFGGTTTQQASILLHGVEDGHARLSTTIAFPREELLAATEQFLSRIPITGQGHNTEAGREEARRQLRAGNISRAADATYEVAVRTGMLRRHRAVDRTEVRTSAEERSRVTTITVEQLP